MKNTLKTNALKGVLLAGMVLALAACNDKGTFTDPRDGKTYKTVKIGSQTWMAENLNYETNKSYCYEDDPANCRKYGRLYMWAAAREACPAGWHLPDTTEWDALKRFVAGSLFGGKTDSAGYALKSKDGWKEYKGEPGNGSDAVGFGALPSGYRNGYGPFDGVLEGAYFWSSTEDGASSAYYWSLRYGDTYLSTIVSRKDRALSVRCVKDS